MKTYKDVQQTKRIVDTHKCDVCSGDIQEDCGYEVNKATIELIKGRSFPEGECTNLFKIDCCADCMEKKVMPLIEKTFNVLFREYNPGFEDDF